MCTPQNDPGLAAGCMDTGRSTLVRQGCVDLSRGCTVSQPCSSRGAARRILSFGRRLNYFVTDVRERQCSEDDTVCVALGPDRTCAASVTEKLSPAVSSFTYHHQIENGSPPSKPLLPCDRQPCSGASAPSSNARRQSKDWLSTPGALPTICVATTGYASPIR